MSQSIGDISRCAWGGLVVFGFLPPCWPQELMELIQEQGLCMSCWQRGSVFGSHRVTFAYGWFHQQISGCLKFPVTLPAFRSPFSLTRDWKAANGHYYRLRSRKVGCCWGLSVSLPRLHLQPAQPISQENMKEFSCRMESAPTAAVCLAQCRHPAQWRNKQALFKILCYPGWSSSVQTEGIQLSNQENAQ